jgi:hypothetical protein
MSVLAYESTDFEATDVRSIGARTSQTNIDSLDTLSSALRQLVDTTSLLFQESGVFGTVGSIAPFALYNRETRDPVVTSSGKVILQGQLLSVTPLSAAGVSLLPGIVEHSQITGTLRQFGTVTSSTGSITQTHTLLRVGSRRFVSEWLKGLVLFDRGSTEYHPISDPTPPIGLQVDKIPSTEDPLPNDDRPDFWEIAKKLHGWLGLTYDDLASITGNGKSTFYDWRHTERTPRPATTQPLLRLYAVSRAMVDLLGASNAAAWFRAGQPSPVDLLRKKDFDAAEQAAAAVLFRQPKGRSPDYTAFAPQPDFDIISPDSPALTRRAPRVARCVRLSAR